MLTPPGPNAEPALIEIRELIYRVAGIYQPDHKLNFLADRCQRRLDALGMRSLDDLLHCLTSRYDRDEQLRLLLNEITVGETCLFRNQPQLDAVRLVILPQLAAARHNLPFQHLRVWSAGCSTGEEAYTLGIVLLEACRFALSGWTFEIVATDLNERSLQKAEEGAFSDYSARNVPPEFLARYFTVHDGTYTASPHLRGAITFKRLNLLDHVRMVFMKGFDLIFCCNVLIYFGGDAKRTVIQHFYNNLQPGGHLFLGHSESLFGVNDEFTLVHFPGATAYRKQAVPLGDHISSRDIDIIDARNPVVPPATLNAAPPHSPDLPRLPGGRS